MNSNIEEVAMVVAAGGLVWAAVVGAAALTVLVVMLTGDADLQLRWCACTRDHKRVRNAFEDKVVWVTGGSQGLGAELARKLVGLGARVIISARNRDTLAHVKASCTGKHGADRVVVLPLDLAAGADAVVKAVEAAEAAFGGRGVDIMLHNAAYARPKLTCVDTSDELTRATFEVNVFGTIALTRKLLQHMMARRRGQFVVVSSAAGKVASPTQGVYAASKHALHGYFSSLASEVANYNISVTLACPGPVAAASSLDTPQARGADPVAQEVDKSRMRCGRCADLILMSAACRLRETWISTQPVLLVMYLTQYLPSLAAFLMSKVGPKRVAALESGSTAGLYSAGLLFQGSTKPAQLSKSE